MIFKRRVVLPSIERRSGGASGGRPIGDAMQAYRAAPLGKVGDGSTGARPCIEQLGTDLQTKDPGAKVPGKKFLYREVGFIMISDDQGDLCMCSG